METDHVIRMEHCKQINFCSRGVREWMARVGLNYMHFLQHGYKISEIAHVNDALSRKLIDHVRREEG